MEYIKQNMKRPDFNKCNLEKTADQNIAFLLLISSFLDSLFRQRKKNWNRRSRDFKEGLALGRGELQFVMTGECQQRKSRKIAKN